MKGYEYCHSRLKRSLDLFIASSSLSLSSPLFMFVYVYNKKRKQPTFFRQNRQGVNHQRFSMIKFETLYAGAEDEDWNQLSYNAPLGKKEDLDPRTGSLLLRQIRKKGLNELPQLLNVINGDMSIVGPRPLPPDYIELARLNFPEITKHWETTALSIKPGLVGVNPLKTRSLPIEMFATSASADIQYVEEATFFGDLLIIMQAFRSVINA